MPHCLGCTHCAVAPGQSKSIHNAHLNWKKEEKKNSNNKRTKSKTNWQ